MKFAQSQLDSLYRSAPGPVVVFDLRLTVIAVNEAFFRSRPGLRDEDVIGKHVRDLFPVTSGSPGTLKPVDVRRVLEQVLATRQAETIPVFRTQVVRTESRDGGIEERYWVASSYPILEEDGQVGALVYEAREVTADLAQIRLLEAQALDEHSEVKSVYDAIADQGIFAVRLDCEGRVIKANRACLEHCGFTLADVLGKPFWECGWWNRSVDIQDWVETAVTRARLGEPFRGESVYYWADGSEHMIEFACFPVTGKDGRVAFVVATGIDITDRVLAERDHRSAVILESITDAFYAIGRDWRFSYLNREAERLLGRSREDLLGKLIWEEFPEAAELEFFAAYRRAMVEHEPASFEIYYPPHQRWYEIRCYPSSEGIAVYFRDVSSRKNTEEELRRSGDRYRSLFNSIDEGFCVLEMIFDDHQRPIDYRYIEINPAFERQTGMKDALGKTIRELVPGIEPFWADTYGRVAVSGEPIRFVDHAASMGRWFDVYAFRIGDPEDRTVAVLFNDVTRRKLDEQALLRSEATLRFLATLDAEIRALNDPDEVITVTGRLLCERLGADQCAYAEVEDETNLVILGDFLQSKAGTEHQWPLAAFGQEFARTLSRDAPYLVSDIEEDPRIGPVELETYRRMGMKAMQCVPLHKAGRFTAAIAVFQKTPRNWTPEEVELVQLVVSRGWEALERTRVAQSLRDSEERLRAIVSQATAGIAETDLAGHFTLVNQRFCETVGYSSAELLGMSMQDITHSDDLPKNADQFKALAKGGPDFRIEKRYIRKDGSIVWVNNSVAAVRDASGRSRSIVAVVFDVTERRKAEEALRESEEELRKFKFLSDNASMAFLLVNFRGQIVYANRFANEERGYAEGELTGLPITCLNHYPEERIAAVFAKTKAESVTMFETLHHRKDGTSFPVEVLATYLELENGPHLFSAVRDITERRAAQARQEQLLRQVESERERLNHVFHRSPSFMATLSGPDHVFELVNERYYQLVGHRDLIGKPAREALPEIKGQGFFELLDQVFETGEPYIGREVRVKVRRSPGLELSERILEFVYEPIRDAEGTTTGVLAHGIDLTEHKLAEEALLEADRRKDEFLAMLAHELRNPLSAIGNAVQVVRRSPAQEHLEWAKEVIEKHVGALSLMIDDLLDVSRFTLRKIELNREILEVLPIVGHAVETIRPLIEEKQHDLTISHSSAPMWVEGDPHRLEQVLVNLLANAAKYTKPGGRITLSTRPDGDSIAISVADNGSGISPEKIPEMFELFAQGSRSIDRSEGGLGIGLTLVKSLVELHGGSVTARSEGIDKGCEFTIRLPAVTASTADRSLRTSGVTESGHKGAKVLVVDDNQDAVRGLVRLLEILGHDVEAAFDGPSAIEAAHAHRPEFILLDIGLPGMDGYQVATRLRAEGFRETTIIAVSGYGEEAARRRSLEAGFNHHFVKPVDYEMLDALMRKSQ